jgi:plasmid stability protein
VKSLHIRNVPEDTVESLKRLARHHHRSLQGELRAILQNAASRAPIDEDQKLHLHTVEIGSRAAWNRDEIYRDDAR